MSWPGVRRAALVTIEACAVLAIEGEKSQQLEWQLRSKRLGDIKVIWVDSVPLDRRHNSKVDYPALVRKLSVVRTTFEPY